MTVTDIRDALREVLDPEIGVNIVDLGLVYGIQLEGATVRITIHPPGRPGVVKHIRVPWTGSPEERERFLNDPDEGLFGGHDL